MISERTLRQWRKDALLITASIPATRVLIIGTDNPLESSLLESQERILRLTQELSDLRLMQKGR